jgi:GntR family transcriptional regulator
MTQAWNEPLPASSPLPLWFQVAERLRAAIAAGEFRPGDPLPSERLLNETFGISRATSRAALDKLEEEGLVSRRSGKGSIVLAPRVDQPAMQMLGFADDMRRRGLTPSYATLAAGMARVTVEVADALGLARGARAFASRRLLKADGAPIGIAVSWLAPRLFQTVRPPTAAELASGSLYEWLAARCGVRIAGASEFIEAAVAAPDLARELGAPEGLAVLIVRRRSRDGEGLPVEYAVLHFRSDRYRLHLET